MYVCGYRRKPENRREPIPWRTCKHHTLFFHILLNVVLLHSLAPGAFMIPYLVMVIVCGIPLVLEEFRLGQCTHLRPVHAGLR